MLKSSSTLLLAVLFTLGDVACRHEETPFERATPVEVRPVQVFNGKDVKRFSAVIEPYEQVELSFRVGGYVDSIAQKPGITRPRFLQDGDRVAQGAVLARLHSTDYDARTQQAKAAVVEAETLLNKAELDRARATKLYESQSLTKADYDAAVSNHEATQARLHSARGRLNESATSANDTVLRAPFAATVMKRNITPGTLAAPGAPAFVLADTTVMKAIFGVPDKLIPRMRIGNTLSLTTDVLASELQGRVTRISAAADPKSRVFEVEVSIPNPNDELRVGMISTLMIEDAVSELGSPVVPIGAIVSSPTSPDNYSLFVVAHEKERKIARSVNVKLGPTLGNLIVIKNGPKVGDQIVTSGAGLLRDGEPIEVVASGTEVASRN
jgi:RND family efflux transporter MFP subunit